MDVHERRRTPCFAMASWEPSEDRCFIGLEVGVADESDVGVGRVFRSALLPLPVGPSKNPLIARAVVLPQTGFFPSGVVDVMCSLRAFGYCFNPISLFFVWSGEDRRTASVDFILAEVNRTIGCSGVGGRHQEELANALRQAPLAHLPPHVGHYH